MVADSRRGRRAAMGAIFPEDLAALLVQGEDGAGVVDDVDPAVGDLRRELEQRLRAEGPNGRPSEGGMHLETQWSPQARGVEAVHRPYDPHRLLRRLRLRLDELDRGRAPDVASLVLTVEKSRAAESDEKNHQACRRVLDAFAHRRRCSTA